MSRPNDSGGRAVEWLHDPVARAVLEKKHTVRILVYLYRNGRASTSEVIREVGGHPASIIETLRILEGIGALARCRTTKERPIFEATLTVKGIQLVETPVHRWDRLLRDWDRVQP